MEIKLSEELLQDAKEIAEIDGCTVSEQIEHWARIGRVMEANPEVTFEDMLELIELTSEEDEEEDAD